MNTPSSFDFRLTGDCTFQYHAELDGDFYIVTRNTPAGAPATSDKEIRYSAWLANKQLEDGWWVIKGMR